MPTFLLLLAVLLGRLLLALCRGAVYVVLLPTRTAMAVAPHITRPRWVLAAGAVASLALIAGAVVLLERSR
jgi:hypothetical protein